MENTVPVEHVVTISREGETWVIDNKTIEAKRNDTIVWKFAAETSVMAYLQFPFDLLVKTRGSTDIVEYETATMKDQLVLHVLDKDEVVGGRPYYYSIFIPECGENQEPGGSYIEGENPPPKIQVGG